MAMVRKDGKLPANARVDVDYTGKKPKISFSYPKLPASKKDRKKGKKWSTVEKDAESQNTIGTHTLILLGIFTLIGLWYMATYLDIPDAPGNCTVDLDEYHYQINTTLTDFTIEDDPTTISRDYDSVNGAEFICDTGNYSVRWMADSMSSITGISNTGFTMKLPGSPMWQLWEILRFFIGVIIITSIFFKINSLITKWLVKRPWYQKWLPEHNAKKRFKKYQKFTAADFDTEAGCFVEVPNFKNVSIEYKTFGDFSPRLKKIKIREHRYHKYDTRKKEVGKLKVEILKWTARFYFDKVPKDGHMEVVYY